MSTNLDKITYKIDKEKQILNTIRKISKFKKKFFKNKKKLTKEKSKDDKIISLVKDKIDNYKSKAKNLSMIGGTPPWGSFNYMLKKKIIDKTNHVNNAYTLWGNKCCNDISLSNFTKKYNSDKIAPSNNDKCFIWLQYLPISIGGFDYNLCSKNKYWKSTAHWAFALHYNDRVIQCELKGVFDVFRLIEVNYKITEFKNFDKFFGNGYYKVKLDYVVDISWHDLVLLCNTHPMAEKTYKMVGLNCQDWIYLLFKQMGAFSTSKSDKGKFDSIAKIVDKNRVSYILEQYPNYTEAKKDLGKGFSPEQKFYLDFLVDHYKEYALGADGFF